MGKLVQKGEVNEKSGVRKGKTRGKARGKSGEEKVGKQGGKGWLKLGGD